MKIFLRHFKSYILRGFLALIPLALSFFVLRFFYVFIDQKISVLINNFIGIRIPGLGIILFLFTLYLIGYLASNVIGRRLLNLLERIPSKIPIIKTIYQIGKQVSSTLSLPGQQAFKKAVLVEYFRPGVWTIGFVTGSILDKRNNEKLLKVFIPVNLPNPTSGMILMLKEDQVIDTKWTIEEAMKMLISGGIIGPKEMA